MSRGVIILRSSFCGEAKKTSNLTAGNDGGYQGFSTIWMQLRWNRDHAGPCLRTNDLESILLTMRPCAGHPANLAGLQRPHLAPILPQEVSNQRSRGNSWLMCSFLWMVVHHVRWKNCIASTLQCTERPRDEVAPAPPCILERQDWSCSWTAWAEPSPSTLALKLHIYITSPAPRLRRVKHCCSWPQLRSLPVRKRKRESMSLLSSPAHPFRKKYECLACNPW